MISSLFISTGPAAGGWTVYPPLSALGQASNGSKLGMDLWIVSMALFVVSSLLGGLNYISTILNMRTKGMSMTRMPLTIWAMFFTAVLGVLSFPVLLSGLILLLFDRNLLFCWQGIASSLNYFVFNWAIELSFTGVAVAAESFAAGGAGVANSSLYFDFLDAIHASNSSCDSTIISPRIPV